MSDPGDLDLVNLIPDDAPRLSRPTECEMFHALKVVVEMVETFAPSLVNSGGFASAKDIIARASS